MKWARKKLTRLQAWQLGAGSPQEQALIDKGLIVRRADGRYELFSLEAAGNDSGQIAEAGDYFKTDATGHPYPNSRSVFEQTHRHVEGDWYEQITHPVRIWMKGDPVCEETEWLVRTGKLTLHPEDPRHYYSARLWGTEETAPDTAVLVFYRVERSPDGELSAIDFNFVVESEFLRTYTLLDEDSASAETH